MNTTMIEVPMQLSVPDLLKAVSQLPLTEFDEFMMQARLAHQQRLDEDGLLRKIYQPIPNQQRARLQFLANKAEAENLTERERIEYSQLLEVAENASVQRAEALIVLAQKRQVSLSQLAKTLQLDNTLE